MSHILRHPAALLVLAVLSLPAPRAADGQTYYDVLLTPVGYTAAAAYGISGSAVAGAAVNTASGFTTAVLWPSTGNAVINLGPSGWTFSQANAVSGNQQVGEGVFPNNDDSFATHALLWNSTASSMVDLNPSGYTYSIASATDGAQQVGGGEQTGKYQPNALLWTGSAASAVNLNPANFTSSFATGVAGGIQVGYGYGPTPTGNYVHALQWQGTAASGHDILPPGYTDGEAMAVSGNQIVGFADNNAWGAGSNRYLPSITHAILWNATTDAYTDLNPATGWTETFALGTNGAFQVGFGYGSATGNEDHALVWQSSNSAYFDLQADLPSNFISSVATAIDPNGNVVGFAEDNTGIGYAVEWVDPPAVLVPEPGCTGTVAMIATSLVGISRLRRCRGPLPIQPATATGLDG